MYSYICFHAVCVDVNGLDGANLISTGYVVWLCLGGVLSFCFLFNIFEKGILEKGLKLRLSWENFTVWYKIRTRAFNDKQGII